MQIPLELTFHNMDRSDAVEDKVRERAAKLERAFDRIIGCRVVVEAPHKHNHKGIVYEVRIDISVPGKDIVVNRSGANNHAHEDVYVAVRDAFSAATRQLEDHARKVRGQVKTHEAAPSD
jgi:ribosomal subunit interface protein